MHISAHQALHLLQQSATGTLATLACGSSGYPYPTLLPFACDVTHAPLILVSALAEHTQNLRADPRAGWLVHAQQGEDVLSAARLTVLGEFQAYQPSALALARYLRYQPQAQRYLDLGDFAFYRMQPERLRYIGGFATMGWLTAQDWDALEHLSDISEAQLVGELTKALGPGTELLGVDCFGADLRIGKIRHRLKLDKPIGLPDLLLTTLARVLNQVV
jgi:putative heme iron utilization protein